MGRWCSRKSKVSNDIKMGFFYSEEMPKEFNYLLMNMTII